MNAIKYSIIFDKLGNQIQKEKKKKGKLWARLVRVFKQQFLVFLEIHVGEKICGNTCNIV